MYTYMCKHTSEGVAGQAARVLVSFSVFTYMYTYMCKHTSKGVAVQVGRTCSLAGALVVADMMSSQNVSQRMQSG